MSWIRRGVAVRVKGINFCPCPPLATTTTTTANAATTATTTTTTSQTSFVEVPGPPCYPVVGTLFNMIFDKDFHKDKTHIYFKKLFQKYGPVVCVKFPGKPRLVMLQRPEDVKLILQETMHNPVRPPMECLKKARYDDEFYEKKAGLVSENGQEWSRLQSILRPKALRLDNVHQYLPQVDQVALDFVQRTSTLLDSSGEVKVDFKDEMAKWSLESVGLISLNRRLGCFDSSLPHGSQPELIKKAAIGFMGAIKECETGSKLWKLYPTKTFKQLQQSMDKLKETCNTVLDEIESKMHTKVENDPNTRLAMVEQLLCHPGLTRKDIITFMIDLIPGGTDTMSDMATVILYLLAKNPKAQSTLQEELDRVLGDGSGPLTPRHLDQLSYVKAVVKEANRLLPPMLGTLRILQEDIRLGNFILQKGWMVFLMTAFSSLDESEFEQHQRFLPERWLRHRPYGNIHPCASLPFSFGTRMCIGRRIAEQEIYTLVARLLHRYSLEWKHGELERPLKYVFSPKPPIKFTFIDRQTKQNVY